MNSVFPIRLSAARVMRGMSRQELSNKIGKSRQAVYKYETGVISPDSSAVIQLAKALDVPIDYLFRPMSVSVNGIEFRKKSSLGIKVENSIREKVKDLLERYLGIEELFHFNAHKAFVPVEVSDEKDVAAVAWKMRSEWGLGTDGISNVIEVLEEHDVKVVELSENKSFDGLSGYANKTIPVIVVNASFPSERKRFTALHELGHLSLTLQESYDKKRIERLCSLFASEMLMPQDVFMRKIGENRGDISLRELTDIQRQYGISVDALMYKAYCLNVITEKRYSAFCKKKNALPDFKRQVEANRTAEEHPVRFERLVYRALADERISVSRASELLGLPVNEVRDRLALV